MEKTKKNVDISTILCYNSVAREFFEVLMKVEAIIYVNKKAGASGHHGHANSEFIYCERGEGVMHIDGYSPIQFSRGILIRVPAGAKHHDSSNGAYRQIAMRVSGANEEFGGGDIRVNDSDGSLVSLMRLIFNIYHGGKDEGGAMIHSLLDLWRNVYLSRSGASLRPNSAVESAKRIIAERFTDGDFLLSDIVKDVPYSEAHLRKLFRESIGVSMQDYLNAMRLDYSKGLLASEGISVAMASEMSGFSDPRYFSRLFKARVGLTPTEYKRKNK